MCKRVLRYDRFESACAISASEKLLKLRSLWESRDHKISMIFPFQGQSSLWFHSSDSHTHSPGFNIFTTCAIKSHSNATLRNPFVKIFIGVSNEKLTLESNFSSAWEFHLLQQTIKWSFMTFDNGFDDEQETKGSKQAALDEDIWQRSC